MKLTKSQVNIIWDCVTRGGDFPSKYDRFLSTDPEIRERVELVDALVNGRGIIPAHLIDLAIAWAEEAADREDFYASAKIVAAWRAVKRLTLQRKEYENAS